MTTALATKTPGGLVAWIDKPEVHARIAAAVGDAMNVDQFIAHMLTAFQLPEVRQCTDASKFTALHECAALGLLPTLNQVRLIPYKAKAADGSIVHALKAMPQWQGFKALMERHPDILEVQGFLVHKRDAFAIENDEPKHGFDPFDAAREFLSVADLRGGYLRILYRNGRPAKYHYVTAKQIAKAQACAQTQNVWLKWYEQMALKTIYRDAFARRAVPIDPLVYGRLQKVVQADDLQLGHDPQRAEAAPRPSPDPSRSAEVDAVDFTQPGPADDVAQPEPATIAGTSEAAQAPAGDEEAITIAQWREEIATLDSLSQLCEAKQQIPQTISQAGHQAILSAIEMREAAVRGQRGERSNGGKPFDPGRASATEQGA